MRIVIKANKQDAVEFCAQEFQQQLASKANSVLGLATGATPLDLYKNLIKKHHQKEISFVKACSFNLDEYLGVKANDPQSYHHYMQEHFFQYIDIKPLNTFIPDGSHPNAELACQQYEQEIKNRNGIDLQLLGIGENGHIGFNEPSSSLSSRTRVKTLTNTTLNANSAYFKDKENPVRLAITVGIATILESKNILMLALGAHKAKALAAAIEGPLSAFCPASALQLHQNTCVVMDEEASQHLKLKDYYLNVEQERSRLFNQQQLG